MGNKFIVLFFLLGIVSLGVFVSAVYDETDNIDGVSGLDDVNRIGNDFNGFNNINSVEGIVNTQRMIRDAEGNVLSTNIIGEEGVINNVDRIGGIDEQIIGRDEYYGYIVEFEEKPVKVKETELKKELKRNSVRPAFTKTLVRAFGGVTSENQLTSKVAQQ
ncbi:MAG: hypothetical protein AABW80_03090, partial [Nanoarchaeota archaeon]